MKTQNKLDRPYTKNPLDSLRMSPRPEIRHQRVLKNLMVAIDTELEKKGIYEALPETELGRVDI